MANIINVEIKSHYGTEHIYITSDHAEAVQRLTGRKTITKGDIDALKKLGFTFEVKQTATI